MDPQTIIDEIETWDTVYGIQANIQDFKYHHHQYIPYLKALMKSIVFQLNVDSLKIIMKNKDSEDYRYYLDMLSLVNKRMYDRWIWRIYHTAQVPFIITQDFNVPSCIWKSTFLLIL